LIAAVTFGEAQAVALTLDERVNPLSLIACSRDISLYKFFVAIGDISVASLLVFEHTSVISFASWDVSSSSFLKRFHTFLRKEGVRFDLDIESETGRILGAKVA
jgi:hypothetical protein